MMENHSHREVMDMFRASGLDVMRTIDAGMKVATSVRIEADGLSSTVVRYRILKREAATPSVGGAALSDNRTILVRTVLYTSEDLCPGASTAAKISGGGFGVHGSVGVVAAVL